MHRRILDMGYKCHIPEPSHSWTKDSFRGFLPMLWRKRTGQLLCGPEKILFSGESKFCMSFGNQGPRVWRNSGEVQNPCCLKSSVRFPQSVMIWAAMSSAGVGLLCFLKSTINAVIYQDILKQFMLPSFSTGLGTCPHCQRYQKLFHWPWCNCTWLASKVAWHEPHRESMGYCQEEDERHQSQCRWPEGHCQSNLGFHYTWAVPQADCLQAMPHWCSISCKRKPNQVLSA